MNYTFKNYKIGRTTRHLNCINSCPWKYEHDDYKYHHFLRSKRLTLSVTAPGDTNVSDTTGEVGNFATSFWCSKRSSSAAPWCPTGGSAPWISVEGSAPRPHYGLALPRSPYAPTQFIKTDVYFIWQSIVPATRLQSNIGCRPTLHSYYYDSWLFTGVFWPPERTRVTCTNNQQYLGHFEEKSWFLFSWPSSAELAVICRSEQRNFKKMLRRTHIIFRRKRLIPSYDHLSNAAATIVYNWHQWLVNSKTDCRHFSTVFFLSK